MHLLNHYFEKKQNKSELSPAAITSRPWMGAIPWDELVPSAGVKDDYKPHAPSDTAVCTSCYVKTAALPYVSLQAIYSQKKKKKKNTPSLSVYNDRAHSETHHYPVQLHLKNPIFFFFFVKNLLQVCGAWMDAAFSRWAACVFTVPLWR